MQYIKIEFTLGLDCEAYQEIENGYVINYRTLSGDILELPEVTESRVIDTNPTTPEWAE
jgi:hypothetical protein